MKPPLPVVLASALLVSILPTPSAPQALGEPVTLDAEPVRVSMFKNGLAIVTTRTQVSTPGEYQIPAPDARFGSLWLSWGGGLVLEQIVNTKVDRYDHVPTETIREVMLANIGTPVSIYLSRHDEWINGQLIEPPEFGGFSREDSDWYLDDTIVFFFETDDGIRVLDTDMIDEVRFDNKDLNITLPVLESQRVLRFDVTEADSDGTDLKVSYLAQGIAWLPSYAVELLGDDQARLSCKAVIINDLMDLEGVKVELITGFPNLRFAGAPSAMGWRSMDDLLEILQSGETDYDRPPSRTKRGGGGLFGDSPDSYNAYKPIAGEDTEDLYFYQIGEVTLAEDERGYFPLFSAQIPCRDVYTWDIGDFIDDQDYYQADEQPQVVWHSLELTNTTDQPWTNAPGMTIKDGRMLGQDTLQHTPPGGTSLLKITQAVSIETQQSELEVSRERNAVNFHDNTYDRVTVEGRLLITNYKNEAVTIKITKEVSGEVEPTDAGPDVVKIASGLRRVNPRSRLTWEIEVAPGREQAATVIYRYSFYTR